MRLDVDDPGDLIGAVKLGRAQLSIRAARLEGCRVCGAETDRLERAAKRLRDLELQLKTQLDKAEVAHG